MWKKKELTIIIILSVLLLVSLGFNFYQYQSINELTTLQYQSINELTTLDSKINDYLEAQGRKCEKETETCLDELTERLTTVTGQACSTLSDGTCPEWCATGADYDCCIEKGYEWIQGRGCYS
jgi:hypothetical protein